MPQVFHPSFNAIARATLVGLAVLTVGGGWAMYEVYRTSWVTEVGLPREQPVPFSHEHHVGGLGIDCRYCHASVEESDFAGMPATKVCMTCHSQVWTNAAILQPVRDSWKTGTPIAWQRVHDLPDYAHFRHSIHVNRGVSCVSCHGRVNEMPIVWKAKSLQMAWCLGCHRDPAPNLRPRDEVTNMNWAAPPDQRKQGEERAKAFHISSDQITNCSVCHY